MAEDDIDVEGEFDLKTELGEEFYDTNELPSKSANLLPEFTSPAWMLEQGWSLDSCMDEKSKATIEKMLLEEQQYMYGRKTSRYLSIKKNVLLVTAGTSKATTPNKSPWTQEEKNTFLRGMGIFGRSWSKIASLIPTRTSLQVKNYAQQYMKNLAKKKAEMEKLEMDTLKSMTETPLFNSRPSSLAATVASITTGQPTVVTPADPQVKGQGRKQRIAPANKCDRLKAGTIHRPTQRNSTTKLSKEKNSQRKLKKLDLSGAAQGAAGIGDIVLQARTSRCNSVCSTSDGISTVNGSSDVSDVSNSSFTRTSKLSDEDDMDIEIDIENDDEENPILLSGSASPSSVYKQLLKSADIGAAQLEKDGGTCQLSETKSDSSLDTAAKPNVTCSSKDFLSNHENYSSSSQDGVKSGDDDSHLDTVLRTDDMVREDEDHHVQTDSIVNGLVAWSGEVLEFDVPVEEKVFPANEITEEERRVHADFFDGKPPKTPERYLKIRSYIIDCWLKSRPVYLNKTCIRPGLKNCGDVNCIGRIHSYLECVGAINFGCEQANYRNPHRTVTGGINSRVKGINKELMASFPVIKAESIRPRKRRIRDESGLWVDEKELEGKTIDHNVDRKKCEAKVYRATKSVYDPFKLVPCTSFSADNPPPYKIEMLNTAVAIMDIHAHISKTEVIGMLGGQFYSNTLTISLAVPCKSMSTGMQCEMDPVSQTQASEQIEDVGMSVVGWYHSHPTFSPDPSLRDIETQQKFQYWFSKGGNQFVGVIISPYNPASPSLYSDIRCLTISESYSKEYLCNVPIKFNFEVIYGDNPREILGPASVLAENYCVYNNRVKLSCVYKPALGITCLSKMLQSVKNILIGVKEKVSKAELSGGLLKTSDTSEEIGQTIQQADRCEDQGQITQSADRSKENGQTIQQADISEDQRQITQSADRSKENGQTIQFVDKNKEHGWTIQQADRTKVDEIILCLEKLFKEKFSEPVESSSLLSSLDIVQSNAT